MQTKLTLDEAWEKSLKMWKWIAEQEGVNPSNVLEFKEKYIIKNEGAVISANCYFCFYNHQEASGMGLCRQCPAVLVDAAFNCHRADYCHANKPVAFYNKLVELNDIRLKKA